MDVDFRSFLSASFWNHLIKNMQSSGIVEIPFEPLVLYLSLNYLVIYSSIHFTAVYDNL